MIAIDEAIEFAKNKSKEIVESGEEHQPIMLILTPEGGRLISLVSMNKDKFKQDMAILLRQLDAYAYIFVNEAWASNVPEDSPTMQRVLRGEIKVSELPLDDRTEILTIMAAENGKSYHGWFAKIRYTPEGERYLDDWKEIEGIPEGRLILREW